MTELSHIDQRGAAQMVDVTEKDVTERTAMAVGAVCINPDVIRLIREQALPKGDVLTVARVAGIQAAKRTADLVPLCHPLKLTHIDVELTVREAAIDIRTTVRATDRTGVEMEALTACSVAALTVYDMCKAADPRMEIGPIYLAAKTGGKQPFRREDPS